MKNWHKYKVDIGATILDALKVIEAGALKFAIVTSNDGKLCGSLSDGDVRRGILKGVGMNENVSVVMNPTPILISNKTSEAEIIEVMKKKQITYLPKVDKDGFVLELVSLTELEEEVSTKESSVILMAGGLGARLGELTANCPKPMLKVGDKPILELIIENFKANGYHNFFLSVNYMSEVIENYFGNGEKFGVKITYLREKERLGTAGSLSLMKPINDQPIIVMNGDLLTNVDFDSLLKHHAKNKFDATMCVRQHDYQIPFGVVHVQETEMNYIEEKPIYSQLVNAGIYILMPELLQNMPQGTFLDMPSFLSEMKTKQNKRIGVFPIHEYWIDIGRKDDFLRAELEYLNRFK